jgi:phenylacetate-CoA ligase
MPVRCGRWALGRVIGRSSVSAMGPTSPCGGMLYGLNLLQVPVIPSGGMDSRARARMVIEQRPTVIAATPSFALYLAGILRELDTDPATVGIRTVIALGEPVPDSTLQRIGSEWGGAAVAQFYGCTEAAPSCGRYTCPHGFHVMEDTHLIETVDAQTLRPVPAGERGLTVITNLCSEASPQIRFLVGDYTTLSHELCECGRTHVRTSGWSGRADDMLNVRGVTLFPSGVEDLLRALPDLGDEFQIVLEQTEGAGERLELVVERRSGDDDAIRRRVEDEVRARWCRRRLSMTT